VFARLRDGEGQHIDVPMQEAIAAQLEMTFEYWPYMKMIATRLGQKPLQPVETFQCKDGYIYVCCIEEHQWQNFVHLMGDPEWGTMEIFGNRLVRAENWDALKVFLEEYISQQTVLDLYKKAQARRIPFAPVIDDGRPAQQRASQGARLLRRNRANPRRASISIQARRSSSRRRHGRSGCRRRRSGSITRIFSADASA